MHIMSLSWHLSYELFRLRCVRRTGTSISQGCFLHDGLGNFLNKNSIVDVPHLYPFILDGHLGLTQFFIALWEAVSSNDCKFVTFYGFQSVLHPWILVRWDWVDQERGSERLSDLLTRLNYTKESTRGEAFGFMVLTIPCHPILLAFLNLPEPRESVTELSILLQFWIFLSVILWGGTTFCPSHLTQPLPTFSFSECLAPFSSRKSPPLSLLALLLPMVFASLLMFPFGFCPLLGVPWFRKVPDLVPWFSNTYLPTI